MKKEQSISFFKAIRILLQPAVVITILSGILIAHISDILITNYQHKYFFDGPDIIWGDIQSSGPKPRGKKVHIEFIVVDIKNNTEIFVEIKIKSKGTKPAINLKTKFEILNESKIVRIDSPTSSNSIMSSECAGENYGDKFYFHWLKRLRILDYVKYKIIISDHIDNEDKYKTTVVSDSKNWPEGDINDIQEGSVLINTKESHQFSFLSKAVAATLDESATFIERKIEGNFEDAIDGYYPEKIFYLSMEILIIKNILEVDTINKIISGNMSEKFVYFGGLSIVNAYREIIDALLLKGIISPSQATTIFDNAANAGGAMFGSYSIVILQASLLDILVVNKKLDLAGEAQKILDSSKEKTIGILH